MMRLPRTAVTQHLIAMTISPSRGESILSGWGYLFPVGNSLEGITSVMDDLQITDRPLQLRMRMPRAYVVCDRALAFPDRFAAPPRKAADAPPSFLDEPREVFPSSAFYKRISRHQEICPTRKSATRKFIPASPPLGREISASNSSRISSVRPCCISSPGICAQ